MKVAYISTYPPDRGNMAEYGWYQTRALAELDEIEHVHVLANRAGMAPAVEPVHKKLTVHRCWQLDSVPSLLGLPFYARKLGVDAAHFNTHIRCWGLSRQANMVGAALIPAFRSLVSRVVVTMHTIGDTKQQALHGELGAITRAGINVANRMYLSADAVVVMLRSMQERLQSDYGSRNVVHIPHGSYGARVDTPPKPPRRVLSFGFWGVFKDADLLVGAVEALRAEGLDVELVLGGGPHPYHPEIYKEMAERYMSKSYVRLTGYVPEAQIGDVFCSASAVVLPYKNNSGASGVMNLARSYGRPLVISADQGLMEQVRDEGGSAIVFGSQQALIHGLRRVLTDEVLERRMGEESLAVAAKLTIESLAPRVAALYRAREPLPQAMEPYAALETRIAANESVLWSSEKPAPPLGRTG